MTSPSLGSQTRRIRAQWISYSFTVFAFLPALTIKLLAQSASFFYFAHLYFALNKQARLHELYVRHTMNPFSKLRSPIRSRMFDKGIIEMAQWFNTSSLEKVLSLDTHDVVVKSQNIGDGLEWM